ncbi:MAG: hypothetical protein JW891_12790 [Candidatus Lokiarchaeota archaeon]|nr:hypothetical protein [Candidatus Lokiarchaeota archaeon]
MKTLKRKLMLLTMLISSLFLSCCILTTNVAADYYVTVGDSWMYDYVEGAYGTGNLTIQVTNVESWGALGAIFLNSSLVSPNEILNNFVFDDWAMDDLLYYGGVYEYRTYDELSCYCIVASISGESYVVDTATGIVLEKTSSYENYTLVDWDPVIEPGEWLVEEGDEWVYNTSSSGLLTGYLGVEVSDAQNYPSEPLGDLYRNGSAPSIEGLYSFSLFRLVFDNITIENAATTNGTFSGTYGGRFCYYVVIEDVDEGILYYVDNATGVTLNATMEYGYPNDQYILVDWSLAGMVTEPTQWLVSEGNEWVYEELDNGSPTGNELGVAVKSVPEFPRSPRGNVYDPSGYYGEEDLLLSYLFVFDNVTIGDAAATGGTFSGTYGGRLCYYVVIDDGSSTTLYVDNSTGIVLNKTHYSQSFVLTDWELFELPHWLVQVGDMWTYDFSASGMTIQMSIEVTSVPEYPDYPLGNINMMGTVQSDQELNPYVFDSYRIANLADTEGTYWDTYGDKLCEYVQMSASYNESTYTIHIDTETGIMLYMSMVTASDTIVYTLTSWDILDRPHYLVEEEDEWTYETLEGGVPQNYTGILVTDVPEYPLSPLGTIFTDTSAPLNNQMLNASGPNSFPLLISSEIIQFAILYFGTQSGTYGGRSCEYVSFNASIDTEVKFDTATGVLLSYMNSTSSIEFVLVAWSQLIGPNITINLPLEDQVFDATPPAFDIWIEGNDVDSTWYKINRRSPILLSGDNGTSTGTLNATIWDGLEDGLIEIAFYANDSIGNQRSARVYVFKDTQAPLISIIFPINGQECDSAPDYDVEITEANVVSTWYTLNDGDPIEFSGTNGTIDSTAWNELHDGTITIRFYVTDVAGNEVHAEVEVIKVSDSDSEEERIVPGYDLLVICGVFSITMFVLLGFIIRKRKNNIKVQ